MLTSGLAFLVLLKFWMLKAASLTMLFGEVFVVGVAVTLGISSISLSALLGILSFDKLKFIRSLILSLFYHPLCVI